MQYSFIAAAPARTKKEERNIMTASTSSQSRYAFAALVLLALSSGADGFVPLSTPAFVTTAPLRSLEHRHSHRTMDTSHSYATVAEPPIPPAVKKGLDDLATGNDQRGEKQVASVGKRKAPSWRTRRNDIVTVHTLEEFRDQVGSERGRIVVVRFFASWCKACKAVAPSFCKLARTYPDVKFVEVPVTPKNSDLHQGLGVPSVPFGHIYHPQGGLVEELKMTREDFSVFANTLRSYIEGSCNLMDVGDCADPYPRKEVVVKPDKIAIQ